MDDSTLKVIYGLPQWLVWGATGLIAITIGAIYFHRRSGTSYGLMNRLYNHLIGKSDFNDKSILEFWNQRKDVERFNALFHLRAKSTIDIKRFQLWLEVHDIDLSKLNNLKTWFDFERRKIMKISKLQAFLYPTLAVIFYFATIAALQIGLPNSALVKLAGEKKWIWLNHKEATNSDFNPFRERSDDWRINKPICDGSNLNSSPPLKSTGLTAKSIEVICTSFDEENNRKFIDTNIQQQKIFLLFAAITASVSVYFYMTALRMLYVARTRRYLYTKLKSLG